MIRDVEYYELAIADVLINNSATQKTKADWAIASDDNLISCEPSFLTIIHRLTPFNVTRL